MSLLYTLRLKYASMLRLPEPQRKTALSNSSRKFKMVSSFLKFSKKELDVRVPPIWNSGKLADKMTLRVSDPKYWMVHVVSVCCPSEKTSQVMVIRLAAPDDPATTEPF